MSNESLAAEHQMARTGGIPQATDGFAIRNTRRRYKKKRIANRNKAATSQEAI